MPGSSLTRTDVLLIESDPELASALEASLTAHGAAVTLARSIDEAETVLQRPRRPELIILDIDLPDADGTVILSTLKGQGEFAHIPAIVLTRAADPAAVDRAWDLRANCVILRPAAPEELTRTITTLSRFWLQLVVLPRSRHAHAALG
jgi:two-component system KDP operon response regulator KdpE